MKRAPILLAMALGVASLSTIGATREELRREREAIEAEHAHRAEACKTQFVVTPCLDTVRIEKQKALSHVSAQEKALDTIERQARADARKKRLADKAVNAASAASAVPAARRASEAASAAPSPRKPAKARQKPADPQGRSAHEQEKRDAFDARQHEIESHREAVERRNAKRAHGKPAPKPLPVPASAGT